MPCQVIVCSTRNGAENHFNSQVQDILAGRLPYEHIRIDLDAALREGLYQRIALVTGVKWSPQGEAQWRQDIIDFYADGADDGTDRANPAPCAARDYLQRDDLAQKSLLAPFLEQLEEALGGLKPCRLKCAMFRAKSKL